jgi:ABC-type transporter Mla subunit MlaD
MVKHGDFPSVAELQNMHRRKYGEQVRALDGRIQQALDEAEKTAEAFASAIFDLSWAQNGQHGNRPAAAPEFPKERETLKNQQNEINELKMQLRQLQAERSKEQEELKGEMARRLREEMEKMRNEFKMEMKAREQSNQTIQAQLSKQDREIKTIVEQQVSGQNNSTGNISTSEVSTLIQQGSSGLRSDLVDLTRRVNEITARLAQNGQDTASLCASIATQVQRLDDQTEQLQSLRNIVENIDLETLDTLADVSLHDFPTWRIKMMTVDNLKSNLENLNGHEFPRLRKDVEGLRLSVDDLKAKNNSLSDMVQEFSNRVVTTVGGLVNNLEQNTRNHEARISQLEGASTDEGRPSTTEMDSANSANPADAVNLQVNAIRTDFDSTKAAVAELSQQVNQISQTMEANSKDFNEQIGTLSHLVSVLNLRWNNLSTKSLAEHIIAQLELIYPNAREIVADIARLKALVERLNGWIKSLEEQVQSFKGKVNGNEDAVETPLPALQEHLELVPDFRSNGVSHKRRRPDSSPNGAAQTIVARTD